MPERMPDLITYEEGSSLQKFQATYPIYTDDSGRAAIFLTAHPTHGVYLTSEGTTAATYGNLARGLTPVSPTGVGPYGLIVNGNASPYQITRPGWQPACERAGANINYSKPYGEFAVVQAALAQASSGRVTAFGANLPGLLNAVLNQQGTVAVRYDKTSALYPDTSPQMIVQGAGGFAYSDLNIISYDNAAQSVACMPRPCIEGEVSVYSLPISGAEDWHTTSATAFLRNPAVGVDERLVAEWGPSTTDAEQSQKLSIMMDTFPTVPEFRQMLRSSFGAWETITVVIDGANPNTHIYDLNVAMHMELMPLTKAVVYGAGMRGQLPAPGSMEIARTAAKQVRDRTASGGWKRILKGSVNAAADVAQIFAPGAAAKALELLKRFNNRL